MMYTQKRLIFLLMLGIVLLTSCLSGIKPLPDKIGDLSMSLSIPVAKAEIHLSGTYHNGLPNWFLNQDVPDWAKYDYIYFTDSVAVDLTRIYENSSEISLLAFKINVWNEFPVKATSNIYFVDNAGDTLYTFEPIDIDDGDVLFNGNVIKSGYSHSTAILDKVQIENLRTAEFLVFHLKMDLKDVKNTNYFPYFDQFKMDCQVGARVDFILKDI